MTRLGMVLYHGIESGADLKEYAGIAEGAGYDSLWVTERYFHEETFSLLGFLAAATQNITPGVPGGGDPEHQTGAGGCQSLHQESGAAGNGERYPGPHLRRAVFAGTGPKREVRYPG